MTCRVLLKSGGFIDVEGAEPRCGVDYCDTCGDCLSCRAADGCGQRDAHTWVIDESSDPDRAGAMLRFTRQEGPPVS